MLFGFSWVLSEKYIIHILEICQRIHSNAYSKMSFFLLPNSIPLPTSFSITTFSFLLDMEVDFSTLPVLCKKIGMITLVFSNLYLALR